MKIRCLFFAFLREQSGTSELEIDFSGKTVADALQHLQTIKPELQPYLTKVQLAVNEAYSQPDRVLHDGDTLALIPPVSGGG